MLQQHQQNLKWLFLKLDYDAISAEFSRLAI
jgi:hypothetical protein